MNKKTSMLIGGVVAVVIAAGIGFNTYQTNVEIEQVVTAIRTTSVEKHSGYLNVYNPADPMWSETYPEMKAKSGLETKVNDLVAEIGEDTENSIYTNIERLCTLAQLLETIDYKKDSTKAAWEDAINGFITDALTISADSAEDELETVTTSNMLYLANALEQSKGLTFFSNGEMLLSEDRIVTAFLSEKDDFGTTPEKLNNYTRSACNILNIISEDLAGEIIPYNDLLKAIQLCGTPAITENGAGGYYDDKAGDGSSASFYGDFADFAYSVHEERAEEKSEKAFHSFHFKGQSIDYSPSFFEYAAEGMQAYVVEDKVYFVSPSRIVTPFSRSNGSIFQVENATTESNRISQISDAALYATATAVYDLIETYQIPEVYLGAYGMSIPAEVYDALSPEAQQAYKGFFIPENTAWGSSVLHQKMTDAEKAEMDSLQAEKVLLEWFTELGDYEDSADYVKKLSVN